MTDTTNVPAPALAKLLSLRSAADFFSEKLVAMEHGITTARQRLTGGMPQRGYDDLCASLQTMVDDLPALKRRVAAAEALYKKCREFVDTLPKGSVLESVKIDVDGHSLDEVRTKIKTLEAELAQLRALPTSSSDIKQRVEDYVRGLAKPGVSGIGPGEKLRVIWAGAGYGPSGPREDRADILPLIALLFPNEMTAALMAEIERQTDAVVPIKDRASKIAALTAEIEQLGYLEEALVDAAIADGADVQRSPSAPPAAVLGVRVAETNAMRAA
jgi:hypothetical protein